MNREKVKKEKHSAYRSMKLSSMDGKPTPHNSDLLRWTNEQWRNLTPLTLGDTKVYPCGTQSKKQKEKGLPSVCRPTIKVTDKTPTLASSYTKKQIKKAVEIKKKGLVISWSKL